MDSGFYAACTALLARSQAMDQVANNLANVSTPGYRAQHHVFRAMLANASGAASPLNSAVNNYSVLEGSRLDLAQGSLDHTSNPLDLAIQGDGFFVVKTANGDAYTRNGNFHVSPQGKLVTAQGDEVIGDSGPIQIVGEPINISSDGTISNNGAIAGKLKVVDFPPGTELESIGNTYYSGPVKAAIPAKKASVQQGFLENSNVNPVTSTVELITVQRYAEIMQRALSMLHSDMNQVAAQDLARVPNNG